MSREVLVASLVTVVLGNVVKVFTADDESTVHLGGNDLSSKDTAANAHSAGEGALVVYQIGRLVM